MISLSHWHERETHKALLWIMKDGIRSRSLQIEFEPSVCRMCQSYLVLLLPTGVCCRMADKFYYYSKVTRLWLSTNSHITEWLLGNCTNVHYVDALLFSACVVKEVEYLSDETLFIWHTGLSKMNIWQMVKPKIIFSIKTYCIIDI